ncbi:MAG TPA: cadherin-like domain-containing protein, partial [Gammaproteobacteria bacterium]|nr:cadherin-like domain-containing protein [Gammaproteobacteria bacterium]
MSARGRLAVVLLLVLVSLWSRVGSAQETLLTEAFDRANSATVGNGWVETEATGAAAGISNGQLVFTDTSDVVRRPMVVHALPNTTSGLVVWEFQLNWSRTGNESAYFVYMQLGDGGRMSADSIDAGVAVNLVWTRIGGVDQQLGFRRGGTVTALRALSGVATVRVSASLEQATYDVAVNGTVVRSQVPFDSTGPLNAVRLFTDALNEANFAGRSFDSLGITRETGGGGNVAPVAANDDYSVAQDNVLSIAAPGVLGNDVDADGDALTARLVSDVSRGSLSLGPGGSFSYSPDVGFAGTDAFTYVASDGTRESAVATVSIEVGQQPVLFTDSFGRANGASVGNGWVEVEAAGAATALAVGRLTFADTSDAALRPLARHGFPEVTSGAVTWEFELDWTRVGSESGYAVYMQLGDGAQMSNDVRNAGVGVNLVWTRIGTQHQMLGSSRSGATTALRQVVGHATIRVNVDVDTHEYDVFVDDVPVRSGLAFDVLVALNTVRFFTDGVNEANFSGRAFDNVSVRGRSSGGGGNAAPTARAQSVRVADGIARTVTLTFTDADGPGPYTFDVVDSPRRGTLADDDGDATVVYTGSSGFVGADSFTFRVNDGLANSNLATVALSVQHYPGATWETRTPAQV